MLDLGNLALATKEEALVLWVKREQSAKRTKHDWPTVVTISSVRVELQRSPVEVRLF